MENPILIRPMGLEIRLIVIPQDEISNPIDTKWHRCNRFNFELLEGKKKHAFKDHCSKDHTSTVKGKSPTTRYVWLVFTFEFEYHLWHTFLQDNVSIYRVSVISLCLYMSQLVLIPHFRCPILDTTHLMLHILDATPSLLNLHDVVSSCYLSCHSW